MTDCPHCIAREAYEAVSAELRREKKSMSRRATLRASQREFAKEMNAHRECRCQELRESA